MKEIREAVASQVLEPGGPGQGLAQKRKVQPKVQGKARNKGPEEEEFDQAIDESVKEHKEYLQHPLQEERRQL